MEENIFPHQIHTLRSYRRLAKMNFMGGAGAREGNKERKNESEKEKCKMQLGILG